MITPGLGEFKSISSILINGVDESHANSENVTKSSGAKQFSPPSWWELGRLLSRTQMAIGGREIKLKDSDFR